MTDSPKEKTRKISEAVKPTAESTKAEKPSGSVTPLTAEQTAQLAKTGRIETPKNKPHFSDSPLSIQTVSAETIPKTQRHKNGNYALVLAAANQLQPGRAISFFVDTRPAAAGYMKYLTPLGFDVTTRTQKLKVDEKGQVVLNTEHQPIADANGQDKIFVYIAKAAEVPEKAA